MLRLSIAAGRFAITLMIVGAGAVHGQEYPNKPIRIVTSQPGGSVDFAARIVAQGLTGPLGQPVIIDNRGGGGTISGEIVRNAAPDGYTLLVTGSSFWIGPLFRKAPYDPVTTFAPVTFLTNSPNLLVVYPAVPVKSVRELIDLAKSKPGELNYASASTGSSVHLAAELFKSMAGVNIVHIPFKGAGPALIALMGGQVQLMFAVAPGAMPHVKSGKLRAVAVTSPKPSAVVPGVPTVAATLPGYETGGASAMYATKGTPAAVIQRLNREVVAVLNQPEVKARFLSAGSESAGSTPAELTAHVKSEMARLGKVVRDAGIRQEE